MYGHGLSEDDAVKRNFKGKVLATALIGTENSDFNDRGAIIIFEGKVEGLYWQMFDDYEYGRLDVSEFYYDIEKLQPQDNSDFKILNYKGELKNNGNYIIKEIIDVYDENLQVELEV